MLNIHGLARAKMADTFFYLSRTSGIDTASDCLPFWPVKFSTANWTFLRHLKFFLLAGSFIRNKFNYFRYNVSRSLDYNMIADFNTLSLYLIFIMQSGSFNRHACEMYRL